jgi:hypothetical protein
MSGVRAEASNTAWQVVISIPFKRWKSSRNLWTSAIGVGSGKVRRDGPRRSRGRGSTGAANAGAADALACAVKKAVIRSMAFSAAVEDGPALVCTVGPVRPRDLDMDGPAPRAPSKSGMLGGLYFVASPAACWISNEHQNEGRNISKVTYHGSSPCSQTTDI